jgi:hypothetical protein
VGGTIHQRKKFLIQALTEIRLVIAVAFNQRAQRQFQNETCLAVLPGLQTMVKTPGFRGGVIVNPVTMGTPQFCQVVIPVGADAQGFAYESTHNGAHGAVLQGLSHVV